MNTLDKGHLAFLKVEQRAVELGVVISKPTREGTRYDAIVDWNGKLYRAQVKWADRKMSRGTSLQVDMRKTTGGKVRFPYYTKDEVDVILFYLPSIDKVLWIGPEQFHERGTVVIRTTLPRNGQKKRVLLADQFVW